MRPALAFDRAMTSRSFDEDGRLRVRDANISKANICPYKGEEIPDWELLGLDRDKAYRLYRDARELEAGAPTFNGIPVVIQHVPLSAEDHPRELVVGTVGTDAEFDGEHLIATVVIWDQDAIDGIERGDKKQLSCGYHYKPDMTPGTHEGERYDGVMREIVGNHLALVQEGRAGADCSL